MITFGKMPYVSAAVFAATPQGMEASVTFADQWRSDATVIVRVFKRVVRAGGAEVPSFVVVVRRKVAE